MKEVTIQNTHQKALVDDEDFDRVDLIGWHLNQGVCILGGHKINGIWLTVSLSAFILGSNGTEVDHRDTDIFNNQKYNLRHATRSQNAANRNRQSNNKSGYKGVYWHKKANMWAAYIKVNGFSKYLGCHYNIKDAALAYNKAAKQYFKEFALFNEIDR